MLVSALPLIWPDHRSASFRASCPVLTYPVRCPQQPARADVRAMGACQGIPIDDRGQLAREAFNIRVEELKVKDMRFLAGFPRPTLGLLYEDNREGRHFKTYTVLIKEKVSMRAVCPPPPPLLLVLLQVWSALPQQSRGMFC